MKGKFQEWFESLGKYNDRGTCVFQVWMEALEKSQVVDEYVSTLEVKNTKLEEGGEALVRQSFLQFLRGHKKGTLQFQLHFDLTRCLEPGFSIRVQRGGIVCKCCGMIVREFY